MPFPVLVGLAIAAGSAISAALSAKRAARDHADARDRASRAQAVYDEAVAELTAQRDQTRQSLEGLGRLRLEVYAGPLRHYADLMHDLRRVELSLPRPSQGLPSTPEQLTKLIDVDSLRAKDLLQGGTAGLASGTLLAAAGYGGVSLLATASTGTAISSLSGIAATNATLAWLGGGTLAAGGAGIAGGVAVLGGLVAAPVLAIGGFFASAKAKEVLAKARAALAEAEQAAAEMEAATAALLAIHETCVAYDDLIRKFWTRLDAALAALAEVMTAARGNLSWWRRLGVRLGFQGFAKPDYRRMSPEQKRTVHTTLLLVQMMKLLVDTKIMTDAGAPDPAAVGVLDQGEALLLTSA